MCVLAVHECTLSISVWMSVLCMHVCGGCVKAHARTCCLCMHVCVRADSMTGCLLFFCGGWADCLLCGLRPLRWLAEDALCAGCALGWLPEDALLCLSDSLSVCVPLSVCLHVLSHSLSDYLSL